MSRAPTFVIIFNSGQVSNLFETFAVFWLLYAFTQGALTVTRFETWSDPARRYDNFHVKCRRKVKLRQKLTAKPIKIGTQLVGSCNRDSLVDRSSDLGIKVAHRDKHSAYPFLSFPRQFCFPIISSS